MPAGTADLKPTILGNVMFIHPKVQFFNPFTFGDPENPIDYIREAFKHYFHWGERKATVLQADSIKDISEDELKSLPEKRYSLCTVIIKIRDFFSFILLETPPLLVKRVVGYCRNFSLTTKKQKPSNATHHTSNLNDPLAEALATRREETEKIKCPIAKVTGRATTEGFYISPSGEKIHLRSGEELLKGSRSFDNLIFKDPVIARYDESQIVVIDQDCLEAAEDELKKGAKKVAVLMFASPLEPGGAMLDGNNGQEEDLCRRSDIFGFMWDQSHFTTSTLFYNLVDLKGAHQVDPEYEKMTNNKMIHVPQVTVFRSGKNKEYKMLEHPFEVGMLVSPALDQPKYEKINEELQYKRKEDEEQLRKLIVTQLKVSYEENYDTVVLGAFGCGAFYNPPELIAKFYKEIIDTHFRGAFKKIIFAILDDRAREHNPEGNLRPFQKLFGHIE